KKILLLEKRKKAKELYNGGWSIRKISKYLVSGKNNVNRWVKTDEKELLRDNRCWKKDRP
ncbi:MAG: hypothetical protein QMD06_02095, partial [Candidatus Altarchaeum sp.]|nr:hypothetical protein [Candidatus Altarchaeum sp.]